MPITTSCPSCFRQLRVPENLLGKNVRCPSCQTTFTASDAPTPPPMDPGGEQQPQQPQPTAGVPAFDSFGPSHPEERDPTGEMRRMRRSSGSAQSAVYGPALGLMITASFVFVLGIVSIVFGLAFPTFMKTLAESRRRGDFGQVDETAGIITYAAFGVVSMIWAGVVFSAAWQMMHLRMYTFAFAGTIVAIVPCSVGCHPCCLLITWPLTLGFGIWGLVMLIRSDVKESFS